MMSGCHICSFISLLGLYASTLPKRIRKCNANYFVRKACQTTSGDMAFGLVHLSNFSAIFKAIFKAISKNNNNTVLQTEVEGRRKGWS